MQNIESTIVELGSIFQQLAHMVKEQEETIQRYPARPSPLPPASVCPLTLLPPASAAGSTPAWRTLS